MRDMAGEARDLNLVCGCELVSLAGKGGVQAVVRGLVVGKERHCLSAGTWKAPSALCAGTACAACAATWRALVECESPVDVHPRRPRRPHRRHPSCP